MWIIFMLLQVCQVCTKQKERNTCGQQNPKKNWKIMKERSANGIYCNHRKEKRWDYEEARTRTG